MTAGGYLSLVRDVQEMVRRTVLERIFHKPGSGPFADVSTALGQDWDVPVVTLPVGFSVPDGTDTEAITFSAGADANNRLALPTIPRDKAHEWQPGTSGVQSPNDPERRVEISDGTIWLKHGTVTAGDNQEVTITVSGNTVTLSVAGDLSLSANGNLSISASGPVAISSPSLIHNGVNVGYTHVHSGVDPGIGNSGPPV